MEVAAKTDVDIIQELLSIYATRKEVIEKTEPKINDAPFKEKLRQSKEQTDRFIMKLMDELSLYGDAVGGEVNRSNNYMSTWKTASQQIDRMNEVELQEQFTLLEQQIEEYYRQINATRTGETGSLDEVLVKQEAELTASL